MLSQCRDAAEPQILGEDLSDSFRFLDVDKNPTLAQIIAEWDAAAHPHSLGLRSCDLIPNPFAGHFPLKLREGEEDIEREPAHRGRSVELLRDRNEADLLRIE